MNIGQIGIASSAAAMPLAQARSSEVDRTSLESSIRDREVRVDAEAEAAEGIGTTHEEQSAGDRDADGRRAWEIDNTQEPKKPNDSDNTANSHSSKDPTGQAGSQFDLSG